MATRCSVKVGKENPNVTKVTDTLIAEELFKIQVKSVRMVNLRFAFSNNIPVKSVVLPRFPLAAGRWLCP
jgi:hypothetical protein